MYDQHALTKIKKKRITFAKSGPHITSLKALQLIRKVFGEGRPGRSSVLEVGPNVSFVHFGQDIAISRAAPTLS